MNQFDDSPEPPLTHHSLTSSLLGGLLLVATVPVALWALEAPVLAVALAAAGLVTMVHLVR